MSLTMTLFRERDLWFFVSESNLVGNMRLVFSWICVSFLIFSFVSPSHEYPSQPVNGDKLKGVKAGPHIEFAQNDDEEPPEDADFEDEDEPVDLINLAGLDETNVQSVTHLHEEKGEVLVPCFGMWWPVGGGPVYDYGVDYYGDYKKKRRRSRKQKKAAKMKKKKS